MCIRYSWAYIYTLLFIAKRNTKKKSGKRLHGGDPLLLCDMGCAATRTPTISVTTTTTVRCDLSILLLSW